MPEVILITQLIQFVRLKEGKEVTLHNWYSFVTLKQGAGSHHYTKLISFVRLKDGTEIHHYTTDTVL